MHTIRRSIVMMRALVSYGLDSVKDEVMRQDGPSFLHFCRVGDVTDRVVNIGKSQPDKNRNLSRLISNWSGTLFFFLG